MIITKFFAATTAIVTLVAVGLAVAQITPPPPPPGIPESDDGQDWQMISGHPAGSAAGGQAISRGFVSSSDMYLYNRRTGKAYKYFTGCTAGGVESDEGCFFAIPVLDNRSGFQVHVKPNSVGGASGR